jgi:hypothetical protein
MPLLISFNAAIIAALLGNAANCLKFMMMATGSAHVWARLRSDGEDAACRMVGQVSWEGETVWITWRCASLANTPAASPR